MIRFRKAQHMAAADTFSIAPTSAAFLYSYRRAPLGWSKAVSELIDNSFDAGATRIELEFGSEAKTKRSFRISDDGAGCDDIPRMLRLGDHKHLTTTKLGRYGVGLKHAACWMWGELVIETTHEEVTRHCRVDWERMDKSDTLNVNSPEERKAAPGARGTRLLFRRIQRNYPKVLELHEELSWRYSPALLKGRQIVITMGTRSKQQALLCAGWQLPDLEDAVEDRFEVNRKRVHLRADIVPVDVATRYTGFNYTHDFRIIKNSSFGSKGLSTSRIVGMVELDEDWALSTNKDDIVDEDNDALEEAIFERCRKILEKSAQQAQLIRNRKLEALVSEELNMLLNTLKAVHEPPPATEEDAAEPEDDLRKPEQKPKRARQQSAKNSEPGESLPDLDRMRGLRMEWKALNDGSLGYADLPGKVIYLNSEHERLKFHAAKDERRPALVDYCMLIYLFFAEQEKQLDRFSNMRDYTNIMEALADYLSVQQEAEEEASKVKA